MNVRDVLASKGSSAVFTIRPDATVSDLLEAFAEHNIGALVVSLDGRTMLGIVSERDVVRKLRTVADARNAMVDSIMSIDAHVCSPDDSFGSLMAVMTEHRVRHVPVLDNGQLIGVLSIGDAVKQRLSELEFERDQLNRYVSGG